MFVIPTMRWLSAIAECNVVRIKYLVHARRYSHDDVAKVFHHIKPYIPPQVVGLHDQSVLLPGQERIRASRLSDDPANFTEIIPCEPHIKTVYDCLENGLKISNDGECAGTRPAGATRYKWIKYSEIRTRSHHLGSALINLGVKERSEPTVGVFATNRVEFFLMLIACAGYSTVLVPIYDLVDSESVHFIINQVNCSIIVANSNANAKRVLQGANNFSFLKTLVIMDSPTSETRTLAEKANIPLLTFSEFEAIGKADVKELILPQPDDLFCIPYTSGTTGFPKGVMLTHRNIVACLSSLVIGYGPAGVYGGTIVSYLPPAHLYEIMNQIASLYCARRIGFYSGNIKDFFDEVRILKPNILPLVPRLMVAVYSKVLDEAKSRKWKYTLFQYALSRKEKMLRNGIITKKSIWDKLIFKKLQEALGGNCNVVLTTSAPIPRDVLHFFRCAAGSFVFEAYGQTEAMAATFTLPHECLDEGSVGPPLPCNHVKLVDVPEMDYWAKNDEGEVCFKGPSVSKGYYKLPEATAELISPDGWLRSGDIGRWLPNGTLKIIDRKKHIFKLLQGKYITPEKIEMVYIRSPLVLQVFIDGFSDQAYIVAIVVPNPDTFPIWAKKQGFSVEKDELLKNRDIRLALLKELRNLGAQYNLNSLEQARNITVIDEPFSSASGIQTPTFKLKRNCARKHFEDVLRAMYKEGPLIPFST